MSEELLNPTEMTFIPQEPDSSITLHNTERQWVMKITRQGLQFNHEQFAQYSPTDFALEFMKIMEGAFDITFHKRCNNPEPEINSSFNKE